MNEITAAPAGLISGLLSAPCDPPTDEGATLLAESGLFDARYYVHCNPDVASCRLDPLLHFLHQGWQEGRRPNPYFDPEYYLAQNPDVAAVAINPLLHYILAGEADGRAPGPLFDPIWYAHQYVVPPGANLLRHFLERRFTGKVSPLAEFDPAHYLAAYPDIAAAGRDPFDHYLLYGYREGRDPSASFDTKFYLHRYLGGQLDQNPLLHWRQWRHALQLHTQAPEHERCVFDEVRHFTRPSTLAEQVQPLPRGATRRAKVLAYYLPQFHAVAENDAWWGPGFTEWTAISRGMPRFSGHYQPRIPRELGHYDLGDVETMRRQIAMAEAAGIFGFVPYFYWFNGRRLLERPLEAFLADRTLDFPFALMWANENWTRRWDGSDKEVLISQDYRSEDDAALLECFARHFADPRYIRIGGRPVLMIYRPALIPDCAITVARWRSVFRLTYNEDPILVMSQSFGATDPGEFGLDGAIEFPPHKLTNSLKMRNQELRALDPQASFQVFAYDDVVAASLAEPAPAFPLIKTAVPGWDNDARREGRGMVLHGSTPAKYQAWMEALVDRSAAHDFFGERIVCVNAWNEWAEGAYLEPDIHYGAAYLNATGRAVVRLAPTNAVERVLLVGHDAFPAGAQMLLLNLGRALARTHGIAVEFLLLGEGSLLAEYSAVAPTVVAHDRKAVAARIAQAVAQGITRALVNTTAAARVVAQLRRATIESVLLVHELPRLMEQHRLVPGARVGADAAHRVIFPAACVRAAFAAVTHVPSARARVIPQGIYRNISFNTAARADIRARLGIAAEASLVLGSGYGDLRKGFDLFLHAARIARRRDAAVHFCWIGEVDKALAGHLAPEIAAACEGGCFHLPGFQNDVSAWLSAADAFALTSREDPFPSVALEAMACGLGVAAFAGSGGIAELLAAEGTGAVVPMSEPDLLTDALLELATHQDPDQRAARAAAAARRFDFAKYAAHIAAQLRPGQPRITVAVPSHNYARFLAERLGSVFAQTHPVEEVLVFDDASTDDSIAVAIAAAADWKRDITIIANETNSGSVFAQWQRAAERAHGAYLWVAEADDSADPELLARLSRLLAANPDVDLAFCDSRAVDAKGDTVMTSYKEYYRNSGASALLQDGLFNAADFARDFLAERNLILNASAVVFRTRALRDSLKRCRVQLPQLRVAGDWHIYVDLLAHSTGRVAYLAAPLNVHRRHEASVTASLPHAELIGEIAAVHTIIDKTLPTDKKRAARQRQYRRTLVAA
jgi:glycosyltransferase involved in cell wall biosynthesis